MPLVERLFWALGRNLTFTGRDSIWVAYYQKMIESPWIGRGPGAFTSISPFTTVIANRLREFGFILSPHSMFLGVFGDGGVVGLIAMLLGYCYVLFDSIRNGLRPVAGSLALVILFGGVTETHEIFGPGPGMFLLIIALSMRGSSQQLPAAHRLKVVAPALHAPPCFASNEGNVENEPRGTH
jgi:O-antigen ligase